MPEIEIQKGHVPGAMGRIIELHGTYYHAHWKFGAFFEAKVAGGLAEFMKRYATRSSKRCSSTSVPHWAPRCCSTSLNPACSYTCRAACSPANVQR